MKVFKCFVERFSGWPNLMRSGHVLPHCNVILIDFGPSESQLEDNSRGLNPRQDDGILDMRYNVESGITAKDLLDSVQQDNLTRILRRYGGVIRAKHYAQVILESRYLMKDLSTIGDLRNLLAESRGTLCQSSDEESLEENIDKVLLALRLFVNDELNELSMAIKMAELSLFDGGLLCVMIRSEVEENHFNSIIHSEAPLVKNLPNQPSSITRGWTVMSESRCDSYKTIVLERISK